MCDHSMHLVAVRVLPFLKAATILGDKTPHFFDDPESSQLIACAPSYLIYMVLKLRFPLYDADAWRLYRMAYSAFRSS